MNNLLKKIIILSVIIFSLFNCANQSDNEINIQASLKSYLDKTFQIQIDTLDDKLVLIDYIGCKPCINKSLNYFFSSHNPKENFVFIIPNAKKKTLNKYYNKGNIKYKSSNVFTDDTNFVFLVDSNNTLYSQNIPINGLSVYHIKNGQIQEIRTIDSDDINKIQLDHFWFNW